MNPVESRNRVQYGRQELSRAQIVCAIDHERGLTWIALVGEIDASNVSELHHVLASLDGDVIVDCARVTFLDSSGTVVFVDAACRLAAVDHLVTLVRVHGAMRRVLEILELIEIFGIEVSVLRPK